MRRPVDAERIARFMRALGEEADSDARVYFTGGVTAVLLGFRTSTVDIDLKLEPESDRLFRIFPVLKERLEVNIELASPSDFVPELPGWRERSPFVAREGRLNFHHYDLAAQALAKIERGHAQDVADVLQLLSSGRVQRDELLRRFTEIEPRLHRYPAIDAPTFRRAVVDALRAPIP